MNRYLLDTNLLVYSLRNDPQWDNICRSYAIGDNNNFVSVVSLGELWSLSMRNEWGQKRIEQLERISQSFIIVDINIESIIRRYAEIDVYSQGKLKGKQLGMTSRNMGKNDLWIAATASALDLNLLTTDRDFGHLSPSFLTLHEVG